MNKVTGRIITGIVGSLTVLGACAVTTSGTPLWGLILVIFMMDMIRD